VSAAPHRQVIDVPGVAHGTMPIPMGVRVGKTVYSSGIHGLDPETQTIPDDPAAQMELVFRHMRTIVENAGGTTGDIGLVVAYLRSDEHRAVLNEQWLAMFPDPADRPARNVVVHELGWNMVVHLMMTAVLP
jgi:2-iminobutanoate/2-iminopropanoate deaminase